MVSPIQFSASNSFSRLAFGTSLVFTLIFLIFNIIHPVYYDDALISMRISRNFIEGNGLFHNLEEKVQTNTSLIYPILVSPFQLLPPDWAIKANVCFDFLLSFLNIVLIFKILRRQSNINLLSAASHLTLIFLVNISFFTSRIITLGMETQLYLLLILWSYYAMIEGKKWVIVSYFTTFCRPEGSLLGIIHGGQRIFENGEWKLQLKNGVLGLALMAIYALSLFWIYDSWIPHTMAVKWNLKPVPLESLHYFIFRVLFNTRYLLQMAVHGIAIWYLIQNWQKPSIRLIGYYTFSYALIFNVLAGGNSFFGWYQAPVKMFLLLLFCLQLAEWLLTGWKNIQVAILGILALAGCWRFGYESTHFNQNGIQTAGKMLNQLTENKRFIITSEPLGFLSYYNMNSQFRDYPGLASKISLKILQENGPISRKDYFDNQAFRKIIQEAGANLILLSRPEYDSFQEIMSKEFVYLGRVGRHSVSEYNSEFLIFANPRTLLPDQINQLKKRASLLPLLNH